MRDHCGQSPGEFLRCHFFFQPKQHFTEKPTLLVAKQSQTTLFAPWLWMILSRHLRQKMFCPPHPGPLSRQAQGSLAAETSAPRALPRTRPRPAGGFPKATTGIERATAKQRALGLGVHRGFWTYGPELPSLGRRPQGDWGGRMFRRGPAEVPNCVREEGGRRRPWLFRAAHRPPTSAPTAPYARARGALGAR